MKNNNVILTILVLLFISNTIFAQRETNHWFFYSGAGINFSNNNIPTSINDGKMMSPYSNAVAEGTSTISDSLGNLLFYSNGVNIWDKNHQVMPNGTGLKSNYSSTQSSVIVKKPGSKNLYYVIVVDEQVYYTSQYGLSYNIVDINLRGGLGDVVLTHKNVLVNTDASEKLAVVKHANNKDYWIIIHGKKNNNRFYVYLLTENGISDTPIITDIGKKMNSADVIGVLKASPNGQKLAMAFFLSHTVETYDFDISTGKITNAFDITRGANNLLYAYGLEFSSNNSLLYVSAARYNSSSDVTFREILQYDLATYTKNTVHSKLEGTEVHSPQMQLALDGKIYVASYLRNKLSVINNPNVSGAGCDFVYHQLELNFGSGSVGLPNFPSNFFLSCTDLKKYTKLPKKKAICFGDSLVLDATIEEKFARYVWQDGSTGSTYVVKKPGIYNVKAYYYDCLIMDDTFELEYLPEIQNNLGEDRILSPQETFRLTALEPNATYNWSTGSNEPEIVVNRAGTYWLDISKYGCVKRDSIEIRYKEPFFPNVITPNGDGKNDAFEILKSSESEAWSIEIFNRFGTKIYESPTYQNDWKGENAPSGLYYYLATEALTQRKVKGWLQVLK